MARHPPDADAAVPGAAGRAREARMSIRSSSPRRMAALLIALAASASAADWPQFGRTATHVFANPSEQAFTPANIDRLALAWEADMGANTATEGGAVIAGSQLFVAGFDGVLSAFDGAGCGAPVCAPRWRGRTANDITGTPAVAGGRVLVASADRFLHVFDAEGCGQPTCAALWRGRLGGAAIDSSVTVAGDFAYVGDYGGRLSVFALAGCGASICDPAWTAQAGPHEQMNSSPTVGAGFVYVQTTISTPQDFTGRLLAFPAAGCGQPACAPAWTADLGGPSGTTASPVLAGDEVIAGSSRRFGGPNRRDHLFGFAAAGCGAPVCAPRRSFDVGPAGIATTPAVSGTTLFASTNASPNPNTVGVLAAFDLAACRGRCAASWVGINFTEGFESAPAVAGDLVFVGKGPASGIDIDAGVFAFDARGCGRPLCQALALVVPSPDAFYLGAPLAVARDQVAFVSNDNAAGRSTVSVLRLTP
jgi:outer membrane protein assembly factor BamB